MSSKSFEPSFLKVEVTKQRLTSSSGLAGLVEAFDKGPLKKRFAASLPERVSGNSDGSYRLGLIQLSSFMCGHDCLADLEEFRTDPSLTAMFDGPTAAPRTMGDFLRDLNSLLPVQAKSYRLQLERMLKKQFKPSLAPHLSIDSTSHVQSGTKIEGLAYNYKDEWCLDSQVIYDELGFCWSFELRSGNTKSGVGAKEQIQKAFAAYKFEDEKYLSGDAAYCNQEIIKTCLTLGVGFTLTANQATTGWESYISEVTSWTPWRYRDLEVSEARERGEELPMVELGRFLWKPSWSEALRIPVIVKRTRRSGQLSLLEGDWKYYGIITNLSLYQNHKQNFSLQEVVEHHNRRGNAENFIREEKYGYDLKHFPCLALRANFAYGLMAMVAHNILRWAAIHENPQRPRFAKAMRRKFIHIPGKIVSHGRTLILKMSQLAIQEVNRLREALELKPYCSPIPMTTS
jgi:Transposase DDE domain group 1